MSSSVRTGTHQTTTGNSMKHWILTVKKVVTFTSDVDENAYEYAAEQFDELHLDEGFDFDLEELSFDNHVDKIVH